MCAIKVGIHKFGEERSQRKTHRITKHIVIHLSPGLCLSMSFSELLRRYKNPTIEANRGNSNQTAQSGLLEKLTGIRNNRIALQEFHPAIDKNASFSGLGLLFIIIDDFPHELIWRSWLKCGAEVGIPPVRIWVHAKYPEKVTSPWVRKHLVHFHFVPEWGSIEITKVMIKMLEEAVADEPVLSKYCFASESCIPLRSISDTMKIISADDNSWINFNSKPNNGYAAQLQFGVLAGKFPSECIYKADQWVLLNKDHVTDLLQLPLDAGEPLTRLFNKVHASDEMYIPTCLSVLGHISQPPPGIVSDSYSLTVSRRRLTYCDWSKSTRNPAAFLKLDDELVSKARAEGCVFLRKIVVRDKDEDRVRTLLSQWMELVLGITIDETETAICSLGPLLKKLRREERDVDVRNGGPESVTTIMDYLGNLFPKKTGYDEEVAKESMCDKDITHVSQSNEVVSDSGTMESHMSAPHVNAALSSIDKVEVGVAVGVKRGRGDSPSSIDDSDNNELTR
eukprot:gene6685-13543_t